MLKLAAILKLYCHQPQLNRNFQLTKIGPSEYAVRRGFSLFTPLGGAPAPT